MCLRERAESKNIDNKEIVAMNNIRNNNISVSSHTARHTLRVAAAMLMLLLCGSFNVVWGQTISSLSDITDPEGSYTLASTFSTTGDRASTAEGVIGSSGNPFKGTIDGQLVTITGTWDKPLFDYVEDATIKNVIIETASVSGSSYIGAIAGTAKGATRIYNCGILSGTVTSSNNHCGSLVGYLDGTARVINCYSYADVAGGTANNIYASGIVGYNNVKTTSSSINTMVMNCMFYGDITAGNKISPVFGGNGIDNLQNNSGLNTFNYYAYNKLKTKAITNYNCALAVEEKYLNRFEFYRLLLNSNKKLAAYYATGSADNADQKMAKWVLETADRTITNPKPYPILKAQDYYPSIINPDIANAPDSTAVGRNKGGKLGKTISVKIQNSTSGGQTAPSGANINTTITLTRTDKDFDRFNFNYDKVQLPYYNDYGTGNYTEYRVVTGWKIVAMETLAGFVDPYTADNYDYTKVYATTPNYFDYPNYNFADRKSVNKDLYSVTGRIFPQGAYFDVPYGVTSITIEPYWGKAIYLSDQYYDVTYKGDYGSKTNVTAMGTQVVTSGTRTDFHGQRIETSITDARDYIGKNSPNGLGGFGSTVYDNAIVLVGNFHQNSIPNNVSTKPYTLMSVDEDNDHEPDYSFIYHHTGKKGIAPIRFDFLNVIGTAQAQKPNGASNICNTAILHPIGWFEITNTALMYFSQLEYEDKVDNGNMLDHSPLILQGGVIEQLVSANKDVYNGLTIYIHVGGNVWFKEFNIGIHGDGSAATAHVPVSVTGGDYDSFYLTGIYNPNASVKNDNAECYVSGGHFGEAAGAGQEQINGNVRWQIYNADIDNFFGGGINDNKPIKGTITTDIYNSHVTLFCGGPKFGNMQSNKNVTTNAVGCEFGTFFGAGYGGNSYSRVKFADATTVKWSDWDDNYVNDRGKYFDGATTNAATYGKKGKGVATDFDYEFFVWSSGQTGGRFYVKYATFSLAQCNNVSSTLTGCTVTGNFYGGGSLGNVSGKATSVLDGCTVNGNVFGGGYSATIPTIEVRDAGFTTNPNYNKNSGLFEPAVLSETTTFTWKNASEAGVTLTNNSSGIDPTNHYVYTDVDLNTLGQVNETDLTIKGNTKVCGQIFDNDGNVTETTGGVFGGGDMSAVNNNTLVKIEATHSDGVLNVFGGGNTADVDGSTEVKMTGGKVTKDIFGGGKGATTQVGVTATVNFGKEGETPGTYEGTGIVNGNIYGGSAYGTVNEAVVNLFNGTMTPSTTDGTTGNVFGGGMGEYDAEHPTEKDAVVTTKATVNQHGITVPYGIFGGGNTHATVTNTEVNLHAGTIGKAFTSEPVTLPDVVFGGGLGPQTSVTSTTKVDFKTTADLATMKVYGNVYGGSKQGSVTAVDVNLQGGTIWGNVFGGGYQTAAEKTAATDITVTLDGTKFDRTYNGTAQIFGANNLQGTPTGHVKVWVKRTVGNDKPTVDGESNPIDRDHRPYTGTTYDLAAVYGGGNQADYVPTDDAAYAEVLIEGCEQTSIEYVYGGGNAAAVPATDVTILGSYIIDYVFGGGNGAGAGNPGANVGIYKLNNVDTNYGSGKAVTKLVGGYIKNVFGGSNTKGNVRGGTLMTMPEPDDYTGHDCCSTRDIKEIYGAGNKAEQDGAVTMILGCVDNMENVYGGAKDAHVKGGVDLVVTSGHFSGVYGGNDTSGSIQGPITVTIEETGCEPLTIDNLYLGGNLAPYSVYGYKDVSGTLEARTKAEYETLIAGKTEEEIAALGLPYADPVLNVVSCTSIGNVFGGGYGSTATMYGNPTVNINMIPGAYAAQIDRDNDGNADNNANTIGAIGNVYGGGNEAGVVGETHVNICTAETAAVQSSMGAPFTGTPQTVQPAYITGDVFGAGKGKSDDVESAMVTGNTNIVMGGGSVAKSVYGGGELSQVTGNTNITVRGGSIGDITGVNAGETYGNVYGGGKGNTTNVRAGLVKGNTNITIEEVIADEDYHTAHPETAVGTVLSSPSIYHNIYGGGAHGSVGNYTYATDDAGAAINGYTDGGTTNITITGGTIGINGHNNGMVFGASRGDIDAPNTIYDNVAWVYNTNVVIGTTGQGTVTTTPSIKGSVYGGGENGHTYHDASVTIHSGMVGITDTSIDGGAAYEYRGNVYGGGCGTDKYYSDPSEIQNPHDGNGNTYNPIAGIVSGNATVLIDGGHVVRDVYGAGSMGSVTGTSSVTIAGSAVIGAEGSGGGYVFAAARGDATEPTMATVGSSALTVNGGTVWGDAYGGGQNGYVNGAVTVTLNGGTLKQDVYGGGALAQTNTSYAAGSAPANTYVTNVTLAGAAINGNLYGGGLGNSDIAANVNGPVTVTVTSGTAANVFGCNNINGAPQSTVVVNIQGTNNPTANIPLPIRNVYGGGNQAAYTYTDESHPLQVNISDGTMGNVFGGGLSADVAGSIEVKVSGGTVDEDVYGGGALANTNTANWTSERATEYTEVTGLTVGVTSVGGYYTKSGSVYTLVTTGTAASGTTYYRKKVSGTWATGMNDVTEGTKYKTNVILTGGLIGNAYGGGLGRLYKAASGTEPEITAVEAMVYGDVKVTVNDPAAIGSATGVAFTQGTDKVTYGEGDNRKEYIIPLTGRVFGCNNQNGTPTGNVKVEVYSTRQIDANNQIIEGHGSQNRKYPYEMQAVYGGGNLSDYLPADGKGTSVYIEGCDETSIEKVYGGGNSASVPATDVTIHSCYDIGYAFGGGNGGDLIKKNGVWIENEGAIVIGLAKMTPKGGKIGQVFGGSDAKGVCGSTTVDLARQDESTCPLVLTRIYGAGNEADVATDVNMIISGCTSDAQTIGGETVNTQIEYVYGGSYNAHIAGDVNLTISSGIFKYVYGGNDRTGSIGGNITVNIEERDDCNPIIIESLLGGGNEAPYPGTKRDGTEITTPGKITVNVKSATYIGEVYGGSFKADVNGDTEVNINMTKGRWAGAEAPTGYSDLPNVHNGSIDDAVGVIGSIYGGGNQGVVRGKSTVNIGTSSTVPVIDQVTYDGEGKITNITYTNATVLGAHITGDVFGGGNLADVRGNTAVNICATEETAGVWKAVAEGSEHVTIGGNVYGGGKGIDDNFFCDKGMVGIANENDGTHANDDLGTHVRIGNGTVDGSVYGGGKVGRVEYHSVVTIGLTPQTGVTSAPEIKGNVFGGGKGVETHGYAALLRGNTTVTVQENAKVRNSVYGGGEISTIGRFWIKNINNKDTNGNLLTEAPPEDLPDGMPYKLRDGGKCTVSILGNAEIGPATTMTMPTFEGNVFGAGKGFLPKVYDYSADDDDHRPKRVAANGDDYFVNEAAYMVFIETQALADETYVTIDGNAFVKGSVYGGSENGRVLNDTHVNIAGGQIGWGQNATGDGGRHAATVWEANYTHSDDNTSLECPSWDYKSPFAPYDPFAVYVNGTYKYDYSTTYSVIKPEDQRENSGGGMPTGSDGHTFYGNVFGGGSGKDPYAPGRWHRKAGAVGGNTYVNITGGHILTSVYGGNEHTDVGTYAADNLTPRSGGKCTVNMTGGTLGVPRTLKQIAAHPVTCYLFGAGKGDQRIFFNTWTNVIETEVNISGNARLYGSTFGGGEDGHVINDAKTNIGGTVKIDLNDDGDTDDSGETFTAQSNLKIGTWGTSYVDGNVFGGGRGFSGEALTAGTVGGNVTVNIQGGTMLGSVYGGGRLASVGTYFTDPNHELYGQFQEDETGQNPKTYGHVTVTISGGTIGNASPVADSDYSKEKYSGNVFGGSMGRITLIDNTINPVWPELAQVKNTSISISGASTSIRRNVYGGGEFGTVRENATISIENGTIGGNVFGGGYGSDDHTSTTPITVHWNGSELTYAYTPMQWAGTIGGNTQINISGGTLNKNVYGGGELASVGIINYLVDKVDSGTGEPSELIVSHTKDNVTSYYKYQDIIKHSNTKADGALYDFGLSWPFEFKYIPNKPNSALVGGKTTVNITGGTFITTGETETGYIFGGGKGKVWFGATETTPEDITQQRYTEAFCANVRETEVTIGSGASIRTVYGGGDDGHVYEDANVIINGGTIARSVFGGGKGTSTYKGNLLYIEKPANVTEDEYSADIHSWTAGKVYGNTSVTMNGGEVGRFVFGGGNMASVGKGNYSGGADDYSTDGYGELPTENGNLWTSEFNPNEEISATNKPDYAYYFLNSGKSVVTILGGRVGPELTTPVDNTKVDKYIDEDGIPYGSVFGGSRGKAAATCTLSPRYRYVPDTFLGYVNKAVVNIGGYINDNQETILDATGPTIEGSIYGGGQDGHVRNSTEVKIFKGNISGQGDYETAARSGHVFGAGSGVGKYDSGTKDAQNNPIEYCNNASGSVTCTTLVEVSGNPATTIIAGNIYGGGALASVGPPYTGVQNDKNGKPYNEYNNTTTDYDETTSRAHGSMSLTKVEIKGGRIGGSVYGASRGPAYSFLTSTFSGVNSANNSAASQYNPTKYATTIWTKVDVTGGTIAGSVYGGGEMGQVKESTVVNLTGGTIAHDAYGGGKGTKNAVSSWDIPANIGGNTTVELNKGMAATGCTLERIFGCNDLNGTPKGIVTVHVYATQHKNQPDIATKYAKFKKLSEYTITNYSDNTDADDLTKLATTVGADVSSYTAVLSGSGTEDEKKNALAGMIEAIADKKYDVQAVYGGGNLAEYEPTDASSTDVFLKQAARTNVIIEGCAETSIKEVYGGGNAASVPATSLSINSAYEIHESYGGGNGYDNYQFDGKWYENPGANVGYHNYSHYVISGESGYNSTTHGSGTQADPYKAIENSASDEPTYHNASTKEYRQLYYLYGEGEAKTDVVGGRIHTVYGGSNQKGNISELALSLYDTSTGCPVITDETYGGSKNATIDGAIDLSMNCVDYTDVLYGASKAANINSDVTLTITNGHYGKIFGGNNESGMINGAITINIEESGCKPIVIGSLYGGGYLADYSIYGYDNNNNNNARTKTQYEKAVATALTGHENDSENAKNEILIANNLYGYPKNDPRINIISATKIDTIYGGGFKALMVGNPYINVNMEQGVVKASYVNDAPSDFTVATHTKDDGHGGYTYTVTGSSENGDAKLAIGTIGNLFGGGNLANIDGDTHVEIGTGKWITAWDNDGPVYTVPENSRNAATITGDVFGGGNNADVTGNTWINIANGLIMHNVYGGGKQGSVGTIDETKTVEHRTQEDGTSNANLKYSYYDFGLSWPVKLEYVTGTGDTHVNITGGRIGTSGDDNGDVFGGGMGSISIKWNDVKNSSEWESISGSNENQKVMNYMNEYRYKEAYQTNVNNTYVTITIPEPDMTKMTIQSVWDTDDGEYKNKYIYDATYTKVNDDTHGSFTTIGTSPGIMGSVYGGSQDGHVIGNTNLTLNSGLIGHALYGGGKGKGSYQGRLYDINETNLLTFKNYEAYNEMIDTKNQGLPEADRYDKYVVKDGLLGEKIYSLTAGKVYGNTNIIMNGGLVMRSIFGGGNLGSIGKGNYSGGADDYALVGFGEMPPTSEALYLWTNSDSPGTFANYFKNSGKASVTITDGTVGFIPESNISKPEGMTQAQVSMLAIKDDLPTGNVFGGCRGMSAPNGNVSPRFQYIPEFFLGYVNETEVTIGDATHSPRIYGSVYGGGQDGHVRRDAKVTINNATIGVEYNSTNISLLGDQTITEQQSTTENAHWASRGNVFGAGSGIGKYKMWSKDKDTGVYSYVKGYNYSSGSVTRKTTVDIKGNTTIYNNVYGGGAIASVGPPPLADGGDNSKITHDTYNTEVIISDNAQIGTASTSSYGGNVFGASKGSTTLYSENQRGLFATDTYTKAKINGGTTHGNVFGGGQVGNVKYDTKVEVSGTISTTKINNDVFGGGDQADVLGNTSVTITGGHILHNVYGGGKMGTVGTITETIVHKGIPESYTGDFTDDGGLYDFALSWPVETKFKPGTGDTYVEITGGRLGTSGDDNGDIFGGGMGSLGIDWKAKGIDDLTTSTDMEKIIETIDNYRYEEQSIANVNNTHVVVNVTNVPDNLDGIAYAKTIWDEDDQEEKPKFLIDAQYEIPNNNNNEPDYPNGHFTSFGTTPVITGSVYGGSENGHVIGNTLIEMKNGIIGHAIYGGGKGKGTYKGRLYNLANAAAIAELGSTVGQYYANHQNNASFVPVLNNYTEDLYSLTAGKVYGNTHIIMDNGFVIRSVYGGGNLGSIGKGNYSGGKDDYSLIGYGERTESDIHNLWTTSSYDPINKQWDETKEATLADHFRSSGNTLIEIKGGQIGYILKSGDKKEIEKVARKDGLPTGNVFGGCRGQASPNGNVSPRYLYIPDFFLGYVNETEVIIGTSDGQQPKILGSVYGGGQDGHVRRSTNVTINQAEIGIPYNSDYQGYLGINDKRNTHWKNRGNVFGAGSGIGSYDLKNNNGQIVNEDGIAIIEADGTPIQVGAGVSKDAAVDYNYSSGSVTCETNVIINDKNTGNTVIHQNVYGGGSLASIGPPNTGQGFAELNTTTEDYPDIKVDGVSKRAYLTHKSTSSNNIIINGGTIGDATSFAAGYGGNVFGASRGNLENEKGKILNLRNMDERYATSIWTDVKAKNGHIFGNVFGGGESGSVTKDTKVTIGGTPATVSGAPRRAAPAEQSNAAAPASNVNSGTGNTGTSTPANVATEAPVNRTITTRQAQ
ncbi:MAG: hypothetical protein J6P66_07420 [Bacteroidaceae bacterium]|nr:hypothetical protein [Bacteroidaceae bacterium]